MKDPAFLFYYRDFRSSTENMTNTQRGAFIQLMCIQAENGFVTDKDMIKICSNICYDTMQIILDKDVYNVVKTKFKEEKNDSGEFVNTMLVSVIEKRKNYTESRRNNRLSKSTKTNKGTYVKDMKEHMLNHMVNVNENVIKNRNEDENEKKEETKVEILNESQEIILFLNKIANRFFDHNSKNMLKHINGRLSKGFTKEELMEIAQLKTFEWANNDKMQKYLTPDTLFNSENCEKYREQLKRAKLNPEQFKNSINGNVNNHTGKQPSAMEAYRQELLANLPGHE
jgi:uncharacterized phage protein (TIGR02220 family)